MNRPLTPGDKRSDEGEITRDRNNASVALSTSETVIRFGSANAELIKGYTGIDNETGQKFAKGLRDIAKHKLHPDYAKANLKQQAGFSAEVAATSRDNAESIIKNSSIRTSRSDDLPQFGKNHNVVDRVQVINGQVIEGSQAQMKFVGDRSQLFERIAREDGKFARYRGTKLELPSEQFDGAKEYCRDKAEQLRQEANTVEQNGKPDEASKLRRKADNYDQLSEDIRDSGLTTEDAIFYREHPKIATILDIGRTSHRAGVEGARIGSTVGACISLLQNAFAIAQEKKQLDDGIKDLARDTGKAAAIGYGTAFAGSAIKAALQQSSRQSFRTLSRTNAPALAVNVCLSLGSSIKRYVNDEITEAQLLVEVGEKGAGMLSASMMAALGQAAIPVPVLGAAIGSMVGYTLSSLFYQSALNAAVAAEISRKRLFRVRQIEKDARQRIAAQREVLDEFTRREIPALHQATQSLFVALETDSANVDVFATAINHYAGLLGTQLQFNSMEEFDALMNTDAPLKL